MKGLEQYNETTNDKKILFPKTHKAIINTTCSIPLTARH